MIPLLLQRRRRSQRQGFHCLLIPLNVFLLLCLQLTQTRSQSTLSARNEIACIVVDSKDGNSGGGGGGGELDLFNYDCSHKNLDWPTLDNLIEPIRGSSNLNLAFNQFDLINHTIYNKSFSRFQLLANTLNLSSNEFERIETYAFYYSTNLNEYEPLKFTRLDLSHNRFRKIPWQSVRHLPKLEVLHFEANPTITQLDFGDLDSKIYSDTTAFESLTKLYFSGCHIETIDANLFKMFRFLEFIDLSSNNLRHLSNRISLNSLSLKYINIVKNPIECDCELLWFKKFLIANEKSYKRYEEPESQMCFINTTKQNENDPLVVESKFIDLIPQPDYSKNVYKSNKKSILANTLKRSSSEDNLQRKSVPISTLIDEQFICELDTTGSTRNYSSSIIELKCRVKSYPKAIIRWMFGQRVLDRLYLIDNKKFKIDEQLIVNNMDPYSFIVESKLIIAYSGSLKDVGREEFSCRTSHIFGHSKQQSTTGVGKYFRAEPVYDQKMILFIVNSNKVIKGKQFTNFKV
jgi:hypothetical protein